MASNLFSSDASAIEARLKAAFSGAAGDLFPDHQIPGTPGYNLRRLWLRLFQTHYAQLNAVMGGMSPRTASGVALDGWGDFLGMPRKQRRSATGTVVIRSSLTGTALKEVAGTATIAPGTRLTNGAATLVTTAAAVIPDDARSVTVAVTSDSFLVDTAAEIGTDFTVNNAFREYLTAETLTAIYGGASAETDEQLRYRLVNALVSPSTTEGYLTRLLANEDVARAEVNDNVYGPGTVEAYVEPALAFPPSTLRATLESIWQGPGRAYVVFPDYEALILRVRVVGDVPASIIVDFLNNLEPGATFVLNALETAIQNAGASDAQVIGIKRGTVLPDGTYQDLHTLRQITNVSARTARTKFYTQAAWVTVCS